MSYSDTYNEPFFPWVESENDRRFKKIVRVSILLCIILSIVVPFLPVPELKQKELKEVSPRLAKLILEKKKEPPPPVPIPKTVKKRIKKEAAKKPVTKKQQAAREKAQSSGLLAMSNELADLRNSFDLAAFDNKPLKKVGSEASNTTSKESLLSQKVISGSKGINTEALSRSTGGTQLAQKSSSNVKSNIDNGSQQVAYAGKRSSARAEDEIERVFQKNKGAIFSIYNRALRQDPTLEGKVVLQITIAPNGTVTNVKIISSELNNKSLERKIIARVKLFRFQARNVSTVTVNYPVDFLPS